jgi:hypothetical protein
LTGNKFAHFDASYAGKASSSHELSGVDSTLRANEIDQCHDGTKRVASGVAAFFCDENISADCQRDFQLRKVARFGASEVLALYERAIGHEVCRSGFSACMDPTRFASSLL